MKMEALDKGCRVGGRRPLFAVDQDFKLTEAVGSRRSNVRDGAPSLRENLRWVSTQMRWSRSWRICREAPLPKVTDKSFQNTSWPMASAELAARAMASVIVTARARVRQGR